MAGLFGSYVVMDPIKLAEVLKGPNGPVVRHVLERATRVTGYAREEAPRSAAGPAFPGRRGSKAKRQPGTLQRSIVKRVISEGGEVVVLVGTDDPVGLFVHEGTVPHVIRPRFARRLVFFWGKVGRVVRFKSVRHPGTKPNRFLLRALRREFGG